MCIITLDKDIHSIGAMDMFVNWTGPMAFSESSQLQSSNGNHSQSVEYKAEILLNNISSMDSESYTCEVKVLARNLSHLQKYLRCSDSVEITISKH